MGGIVDSEARRSGSHKYPPPPPAPTPLWVLKRLGVLGRLQAVQKANRRKAAMAELTEAEGERVAARLTRAAAKRRRKARQRLAPPKPKRERSGDWRVNCGIMEAGR